MQRQRDGYRQETPLFDYFRGMLYLEELLTVDRAHLESFPDGSYASVLFQGAVCTMALESLGVR